MTITCHQESPRRIDRYDDLLIDYSELRPFANFVEHGLYTCLDAASEQSPPNLEIASLIHQERKARGLTARPMNRRLHELGIARITWLQRLRCRILRIRDQFNFDQSAGRSRKVYFILLTEHGRNQVAPGEVPVIWGLYVGQTAKRIEERFGQHLDANHPRAAHVTPRRGYQLLYSASALLPTMRRHEALEFEELVLGSLRGNDADSAIPPLRGLKPRRVKGG